MSANATKKIGVIIPVYNVERYLGGCLDSINKQTFTDYEVILIDDGSTDKSGETCDRYKSTDDRISVVHTKNNGVSVARNIGIEAAINKQCEWIAFIDADDCIHKDYLKTLINACEKDNSLISSCNLDYFRGTVAEATTSPQFKTRILNPEEAVCENDLIYGPCGKLFHISLVKKVDFHFPPNVIFEDERCLYKLLFAVDKISVIDDKLYYYRQSEQGTMRTNWNILKYEDQLHSISEKFPFFYENKYYKALNKSFKFYCELYVDFLTNPALKRYFKKNSKNFTELKKIINNYNEALEKESVCCYYDVLKRAKKRNKNNRKRTIKSKGLWVYIKIQLYNFFKYNFKSKSSK